MRESEKEGEEICRDKVGGEGYIFPYGFFFLLEAGFRVYSFVPIITPRLHQHSGVLKSRMLGYAPS